MLSFLPDSGELLELCQEWGAVLRIGAVETAYLVAAGLERTACLAAGPAVALPTVMGVNRASVGQERADQECFDDAILMPLPSVPRSFDGTAFAAGGTIATNVLSAVARPERGRSGRSCRQQRRSRDSFHDLVAAQTIYVHRRFTDEGHTCAIASAQRRSSRGFTRPCAAQEVQLFRGFADVAEQRQ
jgi:hypothetical protein